LTRGTHHALRDFDEDSLERSAEEDDEEAGREELSNELGMGYESRFG
jgi:hypothetical protein